MCHPFSAAVCSQSPWVCLATGRSKVRTIQLILTLFIIIMVRGSGGVPEGVLEGAARGVGAGIGYSSLKDFNCIEGTHIKIMCPTVLVRILIFFNDYEIFNTF